MEGGREGEQERGEQERESRVPYSIVLNLRQVRVPPSTHPDPSLLEHRNTPRPSCRPSLTPPPSPGRAGPGPPRPGAAAPRRRGRAGPGGGPGPWRGRGRLHLRRRDGATPQRAIDSDGTHSATRNHSEI